MGSLPGVPMLVGTGLFPYSPVGSRPCLCLTVTVWCVSGSYVGLAVDGAEMVSLSAVRVTELIASGLLYLGALC